MEMDDDEEFYEVAQDGYIWETDSFTPSKVLELFPDEEFFEVPQDGYIWETDSFTPSTGLGLRDEEFYEVPQGGYIWETDSFTPSTGLGLEDEEFYEVPQDGDIWETDSFTPSTGLGHREECLPRRGFKYWPSWRIFEYWLSLRIFISGLDFDTTGEASLDGYISHKASYQFVPPSVAPKIDSKDTQSHRSGPEPGSWPCCLPC